MKNYYVYKSHSCGTGFSNKIYIKFWSKSSWFLGLNNKLIFFRRVYEKDLFDTNNFDGFIFIYIMQYRT